MSFATDKWFKNLNSELITEGLDDIGLTELMKNLVRAALPGASEKGRVWAATAWKTEDPARFRNQGTSGWWEDSMEVLEKLSKSDVFTQSRYDDDRSPDEIPPYDNDKNNILDNAIETYRRRGMKNWSKARRNFIKNAKKKKIPNDIVVSALAAFDDLEQGSWNWLSSQISNVIVTLNENPNNYTMIKSIPPTDWDDAEEECYKFQQNKEDPEQIIHTFKDGSFWYDLGVYQCNMEGDRMGHCGTDSRGTLYSLRKKSKNSSFSKSYVTISYNASQQIIYQIKGRSNTCPPEELWPYIEKFVRLMDATELQESGEHSNDEEEFQLLGQYLADETGIEFVGSFEKKLEEFSENINAYYQDFMRHESSNNVRISGPSAETYDYGEGVIYWMDTLENVGVEIPFRLNDKLLRVLYDEDSGELHDELLAIFAEEERLDFLEDGYEQPFLAIINAGSLEQAIQKTRNVYTLARQDPSPLLEGDKTFIVVDDLGNAFDEWKQNNLDVSDPSDYGQWLDSAADVAVDLGDSVDDIEDRLISKGLINAPATKVFRGKVDEEFNNFVISTAGDKGASYDIISTGILFRMTYPELETIVNIGFQEDFDMKGATYSNATFKSLVVNKMMNHEKEAIKFAKRQMNLKFGDKYNKKIESIWDKIESSDMLKATFYNNLYAGFGIKFPRSPKKVSPNATMDMTQYFTYKLEVPINNNTLDIYVPFLEYYDNNFEIVTGAFDYAVKKMLTDKVKQFKTKTNNSTNLPDSVTEDVALDVRLYEIDFVMSYPLGVGFEMTDIHNIIRAIPDVTTVRTKGQKRRASGRSVSVQHLKFALRGQKNRMKWVKEVLLPQIHKIDPRIKILKVDRAVVSENKEQIKEYYNSYSMRQSPGRVTPSPRIQQVLDDWMQGGVMYDSPMLNNMSRESVMIPVEDIKHLLSRNPRKHGDHFEAGYQNFIKIGPRDPIYIAVGKNGRVKITGNEDDLRYAIKAGVEEVPVYFSYQTQV